MNTTTRALSTVRKPAARPKKTIQTKRKRVASFRPGDRLPNQAAYNLYDHHNQEYRLPWRQLQSRR